MRTSLAILVALVALSLGACASEATARFGLGTVQWKNGNPGVVAPDAAAGSVDTNHRVSLKPRAADLSAANPAGSLAPSAGREAVGAGLGGLRRPSCPPKAPEAAPPPPAAPTAAPPPPTAPPVCDPEHPEACAPPGMGG